MSDNCDNCDKLNSKITDLYLELNRSGKRAKEAAQAHAILDDNNVPRDMNGNILTLVGRIQLSWEILSNK